mmetsp:Transcript_43811/g.126560  ORF Transcript_43811/g.126560 Transcript_43811/m.126560 type:complete len:376 (+) Transcript_43811:113-1240(+)
MADNSVSTLASKLIERGYKAVRPLKSASGHAAIFRVQEAEDEGAEPYVAKVVSLIALDAKGRASAQQEVSLLKGLSAHPNLIAYRQSFMEEPGQLFIVMSLADGGDLRCVVTECLSQKFTIPEPVVLSWVRQTLCGLQHLHGLGVVHRDLKSSNIFLCQRRQRVRIGDFGISRVLESTAFATSCVGTPAYMSPELMRNERYDYHVDMWALGCICFELCTLKLPFAANSLLELACQVMEADPAWSHWVGYSEDLRFTASRLLMKEADARPTATQLLSEGLFADDGRGALQPPPEAWSCIRPQLEGMEVVPGAGADVTGGGSSAAESSAHLSRAEFAELLATHHGDLLASLQGGRSAPPPHGGSIGAGGRRVAESVI